MPISTASTRNGKRIRDVFLTGDRGDENTSLCRCGEKFRVMGSGYANFVDHVRSAHPHEFNRITASNNETTCESSPKCRSVALPSFLWKSIAMTTKKLGPSWTCVLSFQRPIYATTFSARPDVCSQTTRSRYCRQSLKHSYFCTLKGPYGASRMSRNL